MYNIKWPLAPYWSIDVQYMVTFDAPTDVQYKVTSGPLTDVQYKMTLSPNDVQYNVTCPLTMYNIK